MISRFLPWFSSVEGLVVPNQISLLTFPKVHVAMWMHLIASWPSLNNLWGPIVLFPSFLAQKMEVTERLASPHWNCSFSLMVVRIDKQEDPTKKQQAPQTDLCLILFFWVWNHRLYIIYISFCCKNSNHGHFKCVTIMWSPQFSSFRRCERWAQPRWRSSLCGAIVTGWEVWIWEVRESSIVNSKRRYVVFFSKYF